MSSTHEQVTVYKEKEVDVNLWCRLCEYMLSSTEDVELHEKYGCCRECWLTFGESRKKDWLTGWRPDSETLNRYKQARRIINIDIMKILGE